MAHFVYILECADKSLYTGYTTDLSKRVGEHNESKRGARYTSGRRPVRLRYSESFVSVNAALKREAEIKKLTRTEKLDLVRSKA